MNPPISPDSDTDSNMRLPGSDTPNYTRVGFGAVGNVHVEHKPTTVLNRTHVEHKPTTVHNETHETHVHHHAPALAASAPASASGARPWLLIAGLASLCIGVLLGLYRNASLNVQMQGGDQKPLVYPTPGPRHDPASQPVASPAPVGQAMVTSFQPAESPPPPSSNGLRIQFDRSDRLYYGGDTQAVRITAPRDGYLYVASVWADGQMRLLCHPDWLTPIPGPVRAGQTIDIPTVKMSFTPPSQSDFVTEEEVRAILSDKPISSLPAERKTDVNQAWRALGFRVQPPSVRYRGGELPDPESTANPQGVLESTAAYRMKRGSR